MPEISRFYGIVIKMFFKPKEHEPSHIHALYGEYVGVFDLKTHEMMDGDLPLKAQNLVKEWMSLNDAELQKMWDSQTIVKLAPLEQNVIPRIKSIVDRNDYKLEVLFDDGKRVLYDVGEDINQIPDFKDLVSIQGLWKQFSLDESRTCVYWNDRIDLPSDSIYEYGKVI